MGFIRYITAFYDTFKICESYFNPKLYSCNSLSKSSFYTPNNFEDHRVCFQNSSFGQEQIFSIYLNLFYPELSSPKPLHFSENHNKITSWNDSIRKHKAFNLIKELYYKFKYGLSKKKLTVGILGSYFSKKNIKKLSDYSKSKIGIINIPKFQSSKSKNFLNFSQRQVLSKYDNDFDKFDKFFFSSLEYCFPKLFIEEYKDIEIYLLNEIYKYPQLKYITSENWISNSQNSLC